MFDLLEELTSLPGPSGYERAVAQRMLAGLRQLGVEASIDRMGNVVGYVRGRSHARKILVTAHTDEVGLMVKHISDDGFLYLEQNGLVNISSLPGTPVQIITREHLYAGVIGIQSAHLQREDEARRLPLLSELWVDVGANSRQEVLARGIRHGTPVIYHPNFRRMGEDCAVSKAIDDRAGCAVLLSALQALAHVSLDVDLYVGAVVQEEVGSRGALVTARRIAPDWAITLDTVPARDPATMPQRTTVELGQGPVIRAMESLPNMMGAIFSERVNQRLTEAARTAGLAGQYDVLRTWTDADTISLQGEQGVSVGGIFIPRRHSHSAAEVVNRRDLEAACSLLVTFLGSLSKDELARGNRLD